MQTRAIPSSAEPLPVVGLGTYRGFDVAPGDPAYKQLPAVHDALFEKGGTLVDSSPMYGRAEQTTGELLSIHEPRSPAFLATKYGPVVAKKALRRWSNHSSCCKPTGST